MATLETYGKLGAFLLYDVMAIGSEFYLMLNRQRAFQG